LYEAATEVSQGILWLFVIGKDVPEKVKIGMLGKLGIAFYNRAREP
jgi:hypothetical protein